MRTNSTWRSQIQHSGAWVGVLLGVLFFLWLHGAGILNPAETGWMMHGDPAQHYLGWEFFRREPWSLPPGRIENFGAPVSTSVVFTDSIPLLALPLKLAGPWLPQHFQYFGFWMLACHALTGWFAWRLLARAGWVAALAGTLLLLLTPALLLRAYGHESLMAHWLILAALFSYQKPWNGRVWLAWLLIAALVHPYLLVMLLALTGAAGLRAVWLDHSLDAPAAGRVLLFGAVVLLATLWLAGYFVAAPRQLAAEGYGHYSANLLTWFDPMDWQAFLRHYGRETSGQGEWSLLLPAIGQSTPGQYEGFAYLGAGVLLLGTVALLLMLVRRRFPAAQWNLLAAVAAALFLLALSNRIGIGEKEVLTLHLPDSLLGVLSVFRSSGRFVWPLTYLVVIGSILACAKLLPARIAAPLLLAAVVLQAYDLGDKLREFRHHFRHPPAERSSLEDPLWQKAAARYPHIALYPAAAPGEEWVPFARLAALNGASINVSYVARPDEAAQQAAAADLERAINSARLRPDTLYILRDAGLAQKLASRLVPPAVVRQADGCWLVLPQGE